MQRNAALRFSVLIWSTTMRFVQVKSAEQQDQLTQHRVRDLLVHQRTQLINTMRSHLAELGIIARKDGKGSRSCWRSSQKHAQRRFYALLKTWIDRLLA
jgi:transposase